MLIAAGATGAKLCKLFFLQSNVGCSKPAFWETLDESDYVSWETKLYIKTGMYRNPCHQMQATTNVIFESLRNSNLIKNLYNDYATPMRYYLSDF